MKFINYLSLWFLGVVLAAGFSVLTENNSEDKHITMKLICIPWTLYLLTKYDLDKK